MTLKLYNYTLSGNCYKVRLLLDFLKLDYKLVPVNFYPGREHEQTDFKKINPLGQLPVLEDGKLRLRETQAILCYLAKEYDPSATWLPKDTDKFAQTMMWLAFTNQEMLAVSSAAWFHHPLTEPSTSKSNKMVNIACAALTILDDHLAERAIMGCPWMVGKQPTIADIACFPDSALSSRVGLGHENFPYLRNWMRGFRRLSGFSTMPGIPEFA